MFAARMAYCAPKGIPLSVFLSWDELDQDAALVWQAQEARRCDGCGTLPEEWNPDQGGDLDAYVGRMRICPGCQRLHRDSRGKEIPPGGRIALVSEPPDSDDGDEEGVDGDA